MSTQLHQMNISYVPVEDRLLLKISSRQGDEYRLWLTRRYTGLLVDVLNKQIDKSGGKQAMAAHDETRRMYKEGAFEKAYDNTNRNYPLGEHGVLAFRINATPAGSGSLQLELAPEHGQGISLNLNASLTYMLTNLLAQGIDQAGWNLATGEPLSSKIH